MPGEIKDHNTDFIPPSIQNAIAGDAEPVLGHGRHEAPAEDEKVQRMKGRAAAAERAMPTVGEAESAPQPVTPRPGPKLKAKK
jgi:hypothetical protein